MADKPTPEDIARLDRWFAAECNNRAWRLAEAAKRSAAEEEEMLAAAYAAFWHWSRVGTPLNIARARMLLGHALALAGRGGAALENARASFDYVLAHESPAWEVAFAHAVLANAAAAAGDARLHRAHHVEARTLGAALADAEERAIFEATFATVPVPA